MAATIKNQRYNAVLDYWFGPDRQNPKEDYDLWYGGAPETDAYIKQEFGSELVAAEKGELDEWMGDKFAAVAFIVVLDQFALNVYRDMPKGFEVSATAIPRSYDAIARGYDKQIPKAMTGFVYMPLMHSEQLKDQEKCVQLFFELDGKGSEFAVEHRDIVKKYGRFPGRNVVHGRESTPEELEYLKNGGVF